MALIKESDDPEEWLDDVPAPDPHDPEARAWARHLHGIEMERKFEEAFAKEHGRLPEPWETRRHMA